MSARARAREIPSNLPKSHEYKCTRIVDIWSGKAKTVALTVVTNILNSTLTLKTLPFAGHEHVHFLRNEPFSLCGRNVTIVRGKKVSFVPRQSSKKLLRLSTGRSKRVYHKQACLCTFSLIYKMPPMKS